jgi:hypothetical protein
MRTLTIALAALAAACIATPAHAALSEAQLAAAALTAGDLGPGFTVAQSGPHDQLTALGVASWFAVYQQLPSLRSPSFQVAFVLLLDAESGAQVDGADATDNLALLRQLGLTLTEAAPPAIGEDTRMYTVSGAVSGLPVSGNVISWRQGEAYAAVGVIGSSGSSAVGYAEQQRDKLAAIGQ